MSGAYGTNFQESEAILAASADDFAELDRIVNGMDDGELNGLIANAERVIEACRVAVHVRSANERGLLR